jgi:hypothetical protein
MSATLPLIFALSSPIPAPTLAVPGPCGSPLLCVSVFRIIMLTSVLPPFSIPYTPNITPYHFLTLIIPLLLSPAALASLAPATVFGLHKVLQCLVMFLDLVLHVVNHLFLHLVELLHLLRRLQGLRLLLQQLLHLGL